MLFELKTLVDADEVLRATISLRIKVSEEASLAQSQHTEVSFYYFNSISMPVACICHEYARESAVPHLRNQGISIAQSR